MPLINLNWANPETLCCEPLLVNTDYIVSIRELEQRTRANNVCCVIQLSTQTEWLLIVASLEAIEEAVIEASKDDYESPSMQAPPWAAFINKNRLH